MQLNTPLIQNLCLASSNLEDSTFRKTVVHKIKKMDQDVIVVNIIISTLNSVCQAHHMLNTHTEFCEINTKWGSVISTRHV